MDTPNTYTAFEGTKRLFQGSLSEVILKIKKRIGRSEHTSVLLFSDDTGKTMDFNFQGNEKDVLKRLEIFSPPEKSSTSMEAPHETAGPGRPKLGVVSREVSLLPRHWEWLATQPSGASATLRKLVEDAKKRQGGQSSVKQAQERAYKFMSVIAGDFAGYEDALRALYKKDKKQFSAQVQNWPEDICTYATELAAPVFMSDD